MRDAIDQTKAAAEFAKLEASFDAHNATEAERDAALDLQDRLIDFGLAHANWIATPRNLDPKRVYMLAAVTLLHVIDAEAKCFTQNA